LGGGELKVNENEDIIEDAIYEKGREHFRQGQFFKAHDLLTKELEKLEDIQSSIPLKQLSAQCLNKIEAYGKAINILYPLTKKPKDHPDNKSLEETWGNLGSVYKGIWSLTGLNKNAILSRDAYLKGFKETDRLWTGANAATMSLVLGEKEKTSELASEVVKLYNEQVDEIEKKIGAIEKEKDDIEIKQECYWALVNAGEAFLLLKNIEKAKNCYTEAFEIYNKMDGKNFHLLSATAKQMKLLQEYNVEIDEEILDKFKPLKVVLFAGHMIDKRGKYPERFPPRLEELVRQEIRSNLETIKPQVSYSGAACGSDIIFLEEMLKLKAEVNIFLPFSKENFIDQSVKFAGGKWIERFNNVIDKANTKSVTTEPFLRDNCLFAFGGTIFQGYGRLRALREDSEPILLTVWDQVESEEKGGTHFIKKNWPKDNKSISINLKELLKVSPSCDTDPKQEDQQVSLEDNTNIKSEQENNQEDPRVDTNNEGKRVIKTLLFSDIAGFSKLEEGQYTQFVRNFLKEISKKLAQYSDDLDFVNTWGDAIFAAMSENNVIKMADYAFSLLEAAQKTLENYPLLSQLNLRIALHAGPVFEETDPITGKPNIFGCHVNRAARLEPVTELGQIYATEQFAALLTVKQSAQDSDTNYACHYVGNLQLVKGFGDQVVYRIIKNSPKEEDKTE
jgi:pilus assembly protein FimV